MRGFETEILRKVINLFIFGNLAGWLAGRLHASLAGWLSGWLANWLASCLRFCLPAFRKQNIQFGTYNPEISLIQISKLLKIHQ